MHNEEKNCGLIRLKIQLDHHREASAIAVAENRRLSADVGKLKETLEKAIHEHRHEAVVACPVDCWCRNVETVLTGIQGNQLIPQVFHDLIDAVICLCGEGPDVMRPQEIYRELIEAAKKAKGAIGEIS